MTHSHNTSTPAMSAETVPSEEFVLVPREPTEAMIDAADRIRPLPPHYLSEAYRAMIAAAPAPNPTPAAKGGDAVREIAADLERSAGKPLVGGSWGGLALEPVARAIAQDRDALSTPTEGPASQTEGMGGDAQAWTLDDLAEGLAALHGEKVSAEYREQADHLLAHLSFCASTSVALTPASSTESMGGDALRVRPLPPVEEEAEQYRASRGPEWCKIFDTLRDYRMSNMAWEDGEPGFPLVDVMSRVGDTVTIADGEWEMVALADEISAALTPPETTEAVPVAWRWRMAADRVWNYQEDRQRIPDAIHEALHAHPDPEAERDRFRPLQQALAVFDKPDEFMTDDKAWFQALGVIDAARAVIANFPGELEEASRG